MKTTDRDLIRFAEKVNFPENDPSNIEGCWTWNGARHSRNRGYGKFRLFGRVMNAHKASFLLFNGMVEDGKVIAHQCNNEFCVNPFHLKTETQSENMQYCVKCNRHGKKS